MLREEHRRLIREALAILAEALAPEARAEPASAPPSPPESLELIVPAAPAVTDTTFFSGRDTPPNVPPEPILAQPPEALPTAMPSTALAIESRPDIRLTEPPLPKQAAPAARFFQALPWTTDDKPTGADVPATAKTAPTPSEPAISSRESPTLAQTVESLPQRTATAAPFFRELPWAGTTAGGISTAPTAAAPAPPLAEMAADVAETVPSEQAGGFFQRLPWQQSATAPPAEPPAVAAVPDHPVPAPASERSALGFFQELPWATPSPLPHALPQDAATVLTEPTLSQSPETPPNIASLPATATTSTENSASAYFQALPWSAPAELPPGLGGETRPSLGLTAAMMAAATRSALRSAVRPPASESPPPPAAGFFQTLPWQGERSTEPHSSQSAYCDRKEQRP